MPIEGPPEEERIRIAQETAQGAALVARAALITAAVALALAILALFLPL